MEQLTIGQLLKQCGQEVVAINNRDWISVMQDVTYKYLASNNHVDIDDLREWYDANKATVPPPKHPNAWGAIFRGLHLSIIGYKQSRYPSNHSRVVAIWSFPDDSML